MKTFSNDMTSIAPSSKEAVQAEKSSHLLSAYIKSTKKPILKLSGKKQESKEIVLPAPALELLLAILNHMGQGSAISLVPVHAELTTQEAADLLNVSRPYLVNLLKENKIPHRKVGTKHRILAKDVIRYKEALKKKRLKALAALTQQAQELDMGY